MQKFRVLAAAAALCGLVAVAAPSAFAEVEPGGWKPVTPGFKVQKTGCVSVNGGTFTISCAHKAARAERRYDTYTGGSHQFEGFFRITSMGGARISLKQNKKAEALSFLDKISDPSFFQIKEKLRKQAEAL